MGKLDFLKGTVDQNIQSLGHPVGSAGRSLAHVALTLWIVPLVNFAACHLPLFSSLTSLLILQSAFQQRKKCLFNYINPQCLITPPPLMSLKEQTFFFDLAFPLNMGKFFFVVFKMSVET